MNPTRKKVPYPDNLWNRVFDDDQPVPADADETLAFLQQKIVDPLKQQILDLRFKEGKTMAESASIVGKSVNQVRLLSEKAIRSMYYARQRVEKTADFDLKKLWMKRDKGRLRTHLSEISVA